MMTAATAVLVTAYASAAVVLMNRQSKMITL